MGQTGEGKAGARGEGIALASIVFASLIVFPAALVLGAMALVRLPPSNGYRKVAGLALILGIFEGIALSFVLFLILSYDPFPGRADAAADQLRKIVRAQGKFKKQVRIDEDRDGIGEYGFLWELAGGTEKGGRDTGDSGPPLISSVFRYPTAEGYVEKYGYYFTVFLPGRDWERAEDGRRGRLPEGRLAEARESHWIAYAWPAVRDRTARGVFAATADGVFYAGNRSARFDGIVRMPRPFSALSGKGLDATIPGEGRPSLGGESWTRVE